jgi:hypothetical protein
MIGETKLEGAKETVGIIKKPYMEDDTIVAVVAISVERGIQPECANIAVEYLISDSNPSQDT